MPGGTEEMLTCTVTFPFATSLQEINREFWISGKVLAGKPEAVYPQKAWTQDRDFYT